MSECLSTDLEWVDALRDTHRALARAQYADVELITSWFRRGAAADYIRSGGLLHSASEGTSALVEAAAVLRMSETAVNRTVDIGLSLDELPCTKEAFAAGDLDMDRVRVIVDITTPCTDEARAELDRRMAERGKACAPGSLRSSGRRWAYKLDPGSESERRKRSIEDRDVRVRATMGGMSTLDGWLPVEAAQTVALRLADMARQEVCAGDPRTFPQRRADALLALADGTGRLTCRCDRGDGCPKTGAAPATSAGAQVQVGVSLDTLLGLQEWPGHLAGIGAIDPDLARTLAKDGRWEWIIAAIDAATQQTAVVHEAVAIDVDTPATGTCDTTSRDGTSGDSVETDAQDEPAGRISAGGDGRPPQQDANACSLVANDGGPCGAGSDSHQSRRTPCSASNSTNIGPEHRTSSRFNDARAEPNRRDEKSTEPASFSKQRAGSAARRAVAAACAAATGGWDDPNTVAALQYRWPEALAKWLRARDGTCRFPGCTVSAIHCDVDHTIRYNHSDPRAGGRTIRSNGACLCRRHHQLKTAGENGLNGWRVRQFDCGQLEWTTPTGEHITTEPEGAETLWPERDLNLTRPPYELEPYDPTQAEQLAAAAGLILADDSTYAVIAANARRWSHVE